MTTADYLEQLTQDRDDLVNNLETKGITGLTGDETFTELVPEVLNIPSGGGIVRENDVNFYDYDGTLLKSYSANEFANITELPSAPTHTGLTSQGWNWSLTDAQNYVASYGKLDIGHTYITDDGKTRIYIDLPEGRIEPYLGFAINGDAIVDWGDGSSETVSGASETTNVFTQHSYPSKGEYVISIASETPINIIGDGYASTLLTLNKTGGSSSYVYRNSITKIEFGNNINNIGNNGLRDCCGMHSVTLPKNIITLNNYAFAYNYGLNYITIPYGLLVLKPYSISNSYLKNISLSNSLTTINANAFEYNRALERITIPNTVTRTYGNTFPGCTSLKTIVIPQRTLGSRDLTNCSTLENIVLSNNLNTIDSYLFSNCYNLKEINLPNVTAIYNSAFSLCSSLSSIILPSSLTNIGVNAFNGCVGVKYYDFTNLNSIPTLDNTNAFTNIPSDCKIVVPDSLYENWIIANNWSTYASYIIKESDWN